MSHLTSEPTRSIRASGASDPRVKVGVGDLAVVSDDATVTTSGLGSCVAVTIADRDASVRGLLHAMLPSAGRAETPSPRPAKYVDSGVDALLAGVREKLVGRGVRPGRLEARIVGGAEMLELTDAVGPRNVDRAQAALSAAGVPVVASDVGDTVGRTVRVNADGSVAVRAADGFEQVI